MKITLEIETDPAYWDDQSSSTWEATRIGIEALQKAPSDVPKGEYRRMPVRDDNGTKVGTLTIDNQE